jgi:hypothetical protein
MSGAERAKAFRVRQKAKGLKRVVISNISSELLEKIKEDAKQRREEIQGSREDYFSEESEKTHINMSSVVIEILNKNYRIVVDDAPKNDGHGHEGCSELAGFIDRFEAFLLDLLPIVGPKETFKKDMALEWRLYDLLDEVKGASDRLEKISKELEQAAARG